MTFYKKIFLFIMALCIISSKVHSNSGICSRVALVNYQEVLVDLSSSQKGEGLRYYLEKDKVSKELLDKYQRGGEVNWKTTFVGSAGTLTLLSSLFLNTDKSTKKTKLIRVLATLRPNIILALHRPPLLTTTL